MPNQPIRDMNNIYQDNLVEINDQRIIFHRYYFPTGSDKRLPWDRIASIRVRPGGCWRLWGTGDLRTWFPQDYGRPGRDRVFIISLCDSFWRIGFTVEDSQKVANILKERGLLQETSA